MYLGIPIKKLNKEALEYMANLINIFHERTLCIGIDYEVPMKSKYEEPLSA